MTLDFSRHFRPWLIPVYVLVLPLFTQVTVVQVQYLTCTVLTRRLNLSVCCPTLDFLCLTHDLRQVRLVERLVYLPVISQFTCPNFCISCLQLWGSSFTSAIVTLPVWRAYLQEYGSYGVCDFLEFGWPVGFDYSCPLPIHTNFHNHKGVTDFPDAIDSYLSSEIAKHRVIGPFSHIQYSAANK